PSSPYPPSLHDALPIYDVLRPHGSNITARFAGKLVVIGSTATGSDSTDRGATPLEKDTFLTIIYCNVVNSMLTDRFIQPIPSWEDRKSTRLNSSHGSIS